MGPALKARGIDYLELAELGRSLHPWRDFKGLVNLLGIMARFRPQVLETHTAKAVLLGRVACWLYRPLARLKGWPVPRAPSTPSTDIPSTAISAPCWVASFWPWNAFFGQVNHLAHRGYQPAPA
ncbi:hypothetical protein DFAR_1350008 [Desulfarculales bacterium]